MVDARLKVLAGARPATVRLKLPLTIGRSRDSALTVRHSQVSRQHCEVYEEAGMLVVNDLGSSNGTFINNQRLEEPTFLYPGENLRIGKVVFEAVYQPSGDEPSDPMETEQTEPVAAAAADTEHHQPQLTDAAVDYEETNEGSFLGIPDIDIGVEPPTADSASRVVIDDGGKQVDAVESADSALDDFFKNLDQ